jgi:raffinose/stachyose/melibiose transport system permease protein
MGSGFDQYLLNSAIAVLLALAILLLVVVPVAFIESHRRSAGCLSGYFFALLLVPGAVTWIPLFEIASNLRSLSSPAYLALTYAALGIPMAFVVLRSVFAAVPTEQIEAGRVDGASEIGIIARILIPQTARAIAVVAVFEAIGFWNELGLATVLLLRSGSQTIPVGISQFGGQYGSDLSAQYAAIAMSLFPLLLLLLAVLATRRAIDSSQREVDSGE